jgi:flagellar FliL protein
MAEQTNNAEAPASSKPKKSKGTFLLVIVGVILLLCGSGAAWFFLVHTKKASASQPVQQAEKQEPEYTVHLESFTVNLADQEENHFLRVTMDLGVAHAPKEAAKEGADTSGFPTAQTRDAILSILAASKAAELLTPDGKEQLKHNLIAALQRKVPDIGARDVYFTEFLVQR